MIMMSTEYSYFCSQDELMNELEELEQEGLDEDLLQIGGTTSLPNVPSTELPAAPGRVNSNIIKNCHKKMFPLNPFLPVSANWHFM